MLKSHLLAAALVGLIGFSAPVRPASLSQEEDLDAFVIRIQDALMAADGRAYRALFLPGEEALAAMVVNDAYVPGATRVAVKERDRQHLKGSLPGEGFQLMLEIFTESGRRGRIASWRADVRLARISAGRGGARAWRIVGQERLATLDGLYRLELNAAKQFSVRDLVVSSTDFRLQVASGDAFVAETDEGVTAFVVRGKGEMRFTPSDEAERTQLRLYAGAESLVASFDQAFIRINPSNFATRVSAGALIERPVDPRALGRARDLFDQHIRQSFSLNLADLSPESWSLSPLGEDCLAEVHTKRFGALTYARSSNEAEDVTLFNRKTRRNIASYASPDKLRVRGRFYNEDDLVDYDVLDYVVNATFTPSREWIEGKTTIRLRVRSAAIATVQLRLDEDLVVRSVSSPGLGRLMHLRVVGQNNLIVNLPTVVPQDVELELTIAYGGRLPPQPLDREAIAVDQGIPSQPAFEVTIPPEPYFVYSNRTHSYPRSTAGDYATATLRITVPAEYDVVATGLEAVGSPMAVPAIGAAGAAKVFVYVAGEPVRYLSCLIGRLVHVNSSSLELPIGPVDAAGVQTSPPGDATRGDMTLAIQAAPRQQNRGKSMHDTAANILQYYASLVGDAPYPSFSLVLTEALLPGGHSPAYFAVLNQPLPTTPFRWQDDPVSFDNFPSFFLAHEIAHQWWGQGVGWRNYHEQWLSEGLSQYFAALYASRALGDHVFVNLMRQMRRWALRYSDQGPVYLGYRLGHVKGEGKIFRALVYNKAAVVLHMLRRLIGDEKFFAGIRHFYRDFRFRKAGTDDLRRVMEEESGISLERFFERWIYGARVPVIRLTSRVSKSLDPVTSGPSVTLRFEQGDEVFDVPVTVTLVYASGARRSVAVLLADKVTERIVPLEDRLVTVEVNGDHAALAEFVR